MKINKLIYNSGYIITEWNLENILSNFKVLNMKDLNIYYDENVNVIEERYEDDSIVMVGYCFDIRDSDKSQNEILRELLLSDSLEEDLDYINGRYNFVIRRGIEYQIFSDASQLRPLIYHKNTRMLASHDSLLNEVLLKYDINLERRNSGFHTELDFTRFKELYKFNPSMYLNFKTFDFVRFYPRTQLQERSIEEIFKEMKPFLDNSRKFLEKIDNDKFVTVTAGIDSRVSAALTRDFSNEIEYLTYTQSPKKLATKMAKQIYKIDEKITTDMKKYLGWNHNIIKLSDYAPSKEKINELSEIYNSKHAYALANYYRDTKKYDKAIHVKSTVFGMGKADFPKELDSHKDTLEFYKKCIHGLPQRFVQNEDVSKEVDEYFKRNMINEGVTKGRHYFDLFHLESRMGNWHSMLTLETDPETEEFIFTNCRKMIDLIQSPSVVERRDFRLYKKIIKEYWPVLLSFGINSVINGTMADNDIYDIRHKQTKVTAINKITIEKKAETLTLKPSVDLINVFDTYSFSIENESKDRKIVKITSFYRKTKAKNKINIIIKTKEDVKVYDILELNKGINLTLDDKPVVVYVVYRANFTSSSWVDAGKLQLDIKSPIVKLS